VVTAIYLSVSNFNFELLEIAKVNGARPWRVFVEITWPLNWIGTVIGVALVFIPSLAESITPRFLGGPDGASVGMILGNQFGTTGTWALGSAMGAFLISFLLAFNDLEISYYNLGAIPTLPTVARGSLRYGLKPELFALAALVNGLVFVVFVVMYLLMRTGLVRFGYRDE